MREPLTALDLEQFEGYANRGYGLNGSDTLLAVAQIQAQQAIITALTAERDRYRDALMFYANEDKYLNGVIGDWMRWVSNYDHAEWEADMGERARTALAGGAQEGSES